MTAEKIIRNILRNYTKWCYWYLSIYSYFIPHKSKIDPNQRKKIMQVVNRKKKGGFVVSYNKKSLNTFHL